VSVFDDIRADMVAKLTANGVPATRNPVAVPPLVLVGMPTMTTPAGVGGWNGTFPVWIVSPPPDTQAALAWRLTQLQGVYAALGFGAAYPDRWGDKECPAYQVTYPTTVPNPAC
jgi:hypothetical protein